MTLGLFAATVIPDAFGLKAFDDVAAGVALTLFLASLPIWFYGFGLAVVRSSRGDDIGVGGLYFLSGSAPTDVRRWLLGALGISVVLAFGTAWANPFAVLEPMLPLALVGLWAARHGEFPVRTDVRAPVSRARLQQGGGR